jgi:hypothetical protein
MLFSPGAAVFRLADSLWSIKHKCPQLTLIVKAKKNCVAYFQAETPQGQRGPGRPAVYGEKVKLLELFDHLHLFSTHRCPVYGKIEDISIVALDLLWKPTGSLIRFVLAITSRGPTVLMCSDLTQNPISAIELYCARVRIETLFDMLKNVMGVFRYRFWTKRLARHSRRPVKNRKLKKPTQKNIATIKRCHRAYERFVMTGAIALGLLQLISLKFEQSVWRHYAGFLRTKSRELPSERTVKSVMGRLLSRDLISLAPGAVMREIIQRSHKKKIVFKEACFSPELEDSNIQG